MALPRKLKNMNLFVDGGSWLGEVLSVQLPKLSRKMEGYRGGGMNAEVKIDMGFEGTELEFTAAGFMREIFAKFGAVSHDALQLRFAGAYQRDDTGDVDAVEVVIRGRIEEIDGGDSKAGGDTEFKVKVPWTYYRLIVNGANVYENDIPNMIEIVDGVDILAAQRAAIGA